jgi:hypothetical protein
LGGCGPVVVRAGSHLGGDPDVRTGSDPAGRPPRARLGHRQRPRGSFGVRAPCRVPRRVAGYPVERPSPAMANVAGSASRPPRGLPRGSLAPCACRSPAPKPLRTPASRPWASLSRPPSFRSHRYTPTRPGCLRRWLPAAEACAGRESQLAARCCTGYLRMAGTSCVAVDNSRGGDWFRLRWLI